MQINMSHIRRLTSAVSSAWLACSVLAWNSCAWADETPRPPKAVDDPEFKKLAQEPEIKDGSGKWDGSLGLGLTMRRGSTSSNQGSMSLDAERNMRDSRLLANVIAVRASQDGARSSDTATADLRGERKLSGDMFGFAGLGLERDALQDMTLRGSVSSGVGKRWLNDNGFSINLYSGLAYSVEHYRVAEDARGAEVLLGSEMRYQLSPNSHVSQRLVAYPDSVGGGARYAMQADLTTRINSHFGLQLAVLQKYREKVVNQNSHADTVVFTGITAAF